MLLGGRPASWAALNATWRSTSMPERSVGGMLSRRMR